MGRIYHHLTPKERIIINELLQEGRDKKHIVNRLGRDESSIRRERYL